jgi:2-enoate reductase
MAAMGIRGVVDEDGDWGERARAYYTARAGGGVGLITTEMTFATRKFEWGAKNCFDPSSDKHLASLRQLTKSLHTYDCKLSVQLTAGWGRVVPAFIFPEWWKKEPMEDVMVPVSASVSENYFLPNNPRFNTRPMTTEEVADFAQSFGPAARNCREAGADCIELHGHQGYLFDQFMTALWNRRSDRYGGSPEKRLTFARETIAAIQRDAGEDLPIIYRYGLTHYLDGGREVEEGLWIAQELEKMGVAALHIDAGCYETHWWPHPTQYQAPGCMLSLAEQVKQVVTVPVIAVGRLNYPAVAEKALVDGQADYVAIGRGLLADPEWVNKVEAGRTEDIIPCISCNEGCLLEMTTGKPTSCTLNPKTGHELEWSLKPLKKKESLLVIGGGPAGLEAARAGIKRGFDVTLWEASDRLGGNLWPAAKPDFKADILRYVNFLIHMEKQLPIKIELNKEATAEEIQTFGADYVVLATGAKMEPLPFEDDGSIQVVSAMDVLERGGEVHGDRILVMGGGLIGCEVAVYLAHQDKQVTLTTRRGAEKMAENIFDRSNREMLVDMVRAAGIDVLADTVPVRFEKGEVVIEQDGVENQIAVDGFVFAGRLQPEDDLLKALGEDAPNVFNVGDSVKPDSIKNAVWAGFNAVRQIEC